jgi:hypothetical protein
MSVLFATTAWLSQDDQQPPRTESPTNGRVSDEDIRKQRNQHEVINLIIFCRTLDLKRTIYTMIYGPLDPALRL